MANALNLSIKCKYMARMTEEEANSLDEEITNAKITLKPGEGGIFTHQRKLFDALDRVSADYIMTRDFTKSRSHKGIKNFQ